MRVGVVCEGPSDFPIFEWSLAAALKVRGIDATFLEIHPTRDRTSGSYDDGGWHQVYQWCVRNGPGTRQRFFGGGLFADPAAVAVDVLLVHVDGDLFRILGEHDLWSRVQAPIPPVTPAPQDVLTYCAAVVAGWLHGTDEATGLPNAAIDAAVPGPAIMASEAWLLAGLGAHDAPETLVEPKAEFAKFWLQRTGRTIPPGIRKLKRHLEEVHRAVGGQQPSLQQLAASGVSFGHAVDQLMAAVPGPQGAA